MNEELAIEWEKVEKMVEDRFQEKIDVQTILYIIGLQEFGQNHQTLQKEQKVDIIHIGVCTVLGKLGYYKMIGLDDEGWPHYKNVKAIEEEYTGVNQEFLLKKAIVTYFDL